MEKEIWLLIVNRIFIFINILLFIFLVWFYLDMKSFINDTLEYFNNDIKSACIETFCPTTTY